MSTDLEARGPLDLEPIVERLSELDLNDEVGCAQLLAQIREFENRLSMVKVQLSRAIVDRSRTLGVTAIELPNRMRATVAGGTRTSYDPAVLEEKLRAAGMPEERIVEIVQEEYTQTVSVRELNKATKMNEDYAAAAAAARSVHHVEPTVTIRKR